MSVTDCSISGYGRARQGRARKSICAIGSNGATLLKRGRLCPKITAPQGRRPGRATGDKTTKHLPGMYAYGRVVIERRSVRAVPLCAVVEIGNQNCCYLYQDG